MSDGLTMTVTMLYDCDQKSVWGAPPAAAGDVVEVPFSVGARLVAAGYAVVEEEIEEE